MAKRVTDLEKQVAELREATQPKNIAEIALNAFANILRSIQGKPLIDDVFQSRESIRGISVPINFEKLTTGGTQQE